MTTSEDDYFPSPEDFPLPADTEYIALDLFRSLKKPWWWNRGLCHTDDGSMLDTFFPEAGTHGGNHLAPARRVCLECPVRYECLADGFDEGWGVFGGHSPSQRRKISVLVKRGSTLIEASEAIDARSRDAR